MDYLTKIEPYRESGCPGDEALERWAFEPERVRDDLPGDHLSSCAVCQGKVNALKAEREAFVIHHPTDSFFEKIELKLPPSAFPHWRCWLVPALAAGLLLGLFGIYQRTTSEIDEVHFKGNALLLNLYLSRHGRPAVAVDTPARLRPGDVVRFGVAVPRPGFLFIANLDEQGHFTRYYPQQQTVSAAVNASGQQQFLPGSIRLDQFIGTECIALIFSDQPLEETLVRRAINEAFQHNAGQLKPMNNLHLDAEVYWQCLEKVPAP